MNAGSCNKKTQTGHCEKSGAIKSLSIYKLLIYNITYSENEKRYNLFRKKFVVVTQKPF